MEDLMQKGQLFKEYTIIKKLGSGTFGEVYAGKNKNTGEMIAIKCAYKQHQLILNYEQKILQQLQDGVGIPKIIDFIENKMIFELMGADLQRLLQTCGGKFSIRCVCIMAIQILDRLEYLHSNFIIHRDIKPQNFMINVNNNRMIQMMDYGLCLEYRNPDTLEHIQSSCDNQFIGTVRYASIRAHLGEELSRRDDLESLGYMLIYFAKGQLPWQGVNAVNEQQKQEKILSGFVQKYSKLLFFNKDIFKQYVNYCKNLGFDQNPDYNFLRKMFQNELFQDNNFELSFDWEGKKISQEQQKQSNSNYVYH